MTFKALKEFMVRFFFENHATLKLYSCNLNYNILLQGNLNPKRAGLFPPGAALGGGGGWKKPLCKIRSRHPRKLKFTGLIAYIMFYKICKFKSITIINDVIMTSLPETMAKIWYLTLTSIIFDSDNQEV